MFQFLLQYGGGLLWEVPLYSYTKSSKTTVLLMLYQNFVPIYIIILKIDIGIYGILLMVCIVAKKN